MNFFRETAFVLLILSSCIAKVPSVYQERSQSEKIMVSFNEVCKIKYKRHQNPYDWQPLFKTEKLQTGDCKEKARYLQELWAKDGIKSRLVIGKISTNSLEYHAWNETFFNGTNYWFDSVHEMHFSAGNGKGPFGWYFEDKTLDITKWGDYGDRMGKNKGCFGNGIWIR